uniref:Uncharacterized protein n=1 Tax=viral metagenome TaxID=1070528 RepID=A0A6M3M1T9_9ZZZZ
MMINEIKPVAYIKSVIENTDSWSIIIEIPKPKLMALLPRLGEGLPILGYIYSLEIIQDKQSIIDRIERKDKINNMINKYRETMNIVDRIDEQLEYMIKE